MKKKKNRKNVTSSTGFFHKRLLYHLTSSPQFPFPIHFISIIGPNKFCEMRNQFRVFFSFFLSFSTNNVSLARTVFSFSSSDVPDDVDYNFCVHPKGEFRLLHDSRLICILFERSYEIQMDDNYFRKTESLFRKKYRGTILIFSNDDSFKCEITMLRGKKFSRSNKRNHFRKNFSSRVKGKPFYFNYYPR